MQLYALGIPAPERLLHVTLEAILPRLSVVEGQLNPVDRCASPVVGKTLYSIHALQIGERNHLVVSGFAYNGLQSLETDVRDMQQTTRDGPEPVRYIVCSHGGKRRSRGGGLSIRDRKSVV